MSSRYTKGRGLFGAMTINSTATIAAANITTLTSTSTGTFAAANITTLTSTSTGTFSAASIADLDVSSTATIAALNVPALTSTSTGTFSAASIADLDVSSTATIAALSVPALTSTSTGTFAALNVTTPSIGGTALTASAAELNYSDKSETGAIEYNYVVPFTHAAATTEVDTTYDLPEQAIVRYCDLYITVAGSSGYTVDVGLLSTSSGDADGFIDGMETDIVGCKAPYLTVAGSSGFTFPARLGALLSSVSTTSTDASNCLVPVHYTGYIAGATGASVARSITYTANSTGTTLAGKIILGLTVYSAT